MKLKKVHVTNFKCVRDSTEFSIEPNVTCLVGKNESGKTALLHAIEKANPLEETRAAFDILEYPRFEMADYNLRAAVKPDNALVLTWELEDKDLQVVQDVLGPGVVKEKEFTTTKGYYEQSYWSLAIDEAKALENLLNSVELHEEERTRLRALETLKAVRGALTRPKGAKQEGADPLSPREQELLARVEADFKGDTFTSVARRVLQLPKMVYFTEYLRMPGEVSLNDLKARRAPEGKGITDGQKVFLALLSMIGRTAEDLEQIGEFERLQGELEGVSNKLTREIFRYWKQNQFLRVHFRFEKGLPNDDPPFNEGYVMRTRIENTRHGVSTNFDERSSGFVWFFSFLVWFNQAQQNYGENLVLLLDEPGLGLHASAQGDLLRYIDERLGEKYQVIYTTHSPFMIDAANLLRARTVEDIYVPAQKDPPQDEKDLGTTVGDDVLSTDKDTLFPLRAALGYEITQTLFIGAHSLLVEGPSELLYLPWFSRKLQSLGRVGLDKRWVSVPCGGADKVPAFLSLFSGQKLHIAILLDYATGQKGKVQRLRESKLLKDGHVFTLDQYAKQPEADIEDVVGRESYVHLVNDCYGLQSKQRLPKTRPTNAPTRVVKEVEEHFALVATSGEEFDHFRPAEHLTKQGLDYQLPGLENALGNLETLFKDLNALL